MGKRLFDTRKSVFYILLVIGLSIITSCNTTKHLGEKDYLVRKNSITLKSEKKIANKGELKDNLGRFMIQKPNNTVFGIPLKLLLYNRHYYRLHEKPDSLLPKSVERPVIFDSSLMVKSAESIKNYLNIQGYFYATVKDTVRFSKKKAYPTYNVSTGINYAINNVNYNVDDSVISGIVQSVAGESGLKKGKDFSYLMLDDERSRITAVVRNNGFYYFSTENVSFLHGMDTIDKSVFKNVESPFQNAVNFVSPVKSGGAHTIDLEAKVRLSDEPKAYTRYTIASVTVYPDYSSAKDLKDSTLEENMVDSILFRYHSKYLHSKILAQHIYLFPGQYFSQADLDKTTKKLNDLGIFQYINTVFRERKDNKTVLDCYILLSKVKKFDFTVNPVVSSGSTYSLGSSIGVNLRNRNFAKGANLLTFGVNGGIELAYNAGNDFIHNFNLLTKYYGVNASIDFPKFIAPVPNSLFDNGNLPHTILGGGENVIDRVNYFTLQNTSANFSYNWHETQSKIWSLSPAFVNVINVIKSDSFDRVLKGNEYLRNSYSSNFIEGENISFTFDNIIKKAGLNYTYLKLSLEEAGELLRAFNETGAALNDAYQTGKYAQYAKFDFDARHYFTLPHSVFAFRSSGGVGIPHGQSSTLPYIKQYFAGGPYSLRGWRIRTLGPGSYLNDTIKSQIDRTGDIKLELNGEYRFPIAPLFAGAIKMNGAIFADAGNIWLTNKDSTYVGGEFEFKTLGQDIAADIGAGARFDIASFLTLRLDFAMPVKKPYVFSNNGWVFNQIDFSNSTWRANNIIINISIGYPF